MYPTCKVSLILDTLDVSDNDIFSDAHESSSNGTTSALHFEPDDGNTGTDKYALQHPFCRKPRSVLFRAGSKGDLHRVCPAFVLRRWSQFVGNTLVKFSPISTF